MCDTECMSLRARAICARHNTCCSQVLCLVLQHQYALQVHDDAKASCNQLVELLTRSALHMLEYLILYVGHGHECMEQHTEWPLS